ncbi:hypothetical protein KIN20_013072 [Parelaphostrongylus tenuis]|uniref:Uncharacterized protein n=1 Tax=Parelaphostrongylus tenuis TaxID=148309 RepID=A0AAD5MWZ9_PARTN|nr:hypothetical protein KIN20_013072 [Parelaphostrongylus tenuis]
MERLSTSLILLISTIAVVLGCGVMSQGQAMTRNFIVTGFRLPAAMVFTTSTGAAAQLPGGIASTSNGAKSFVSRLVMKTINYDPLECKKVTVGIPQNNMIMRGNDVPHCVVVGETVTILCGGNMMNDMCNLSTGDKTEPIPAKHMSFSGSLTTTNIIMANWSREMWQGVLNRAIRLLGLSPVGSHFFAAVVTVN